MQTYKDQVDGLREQLNKARGALARNVAAAVVTTDWSKFLRDRYDIQALVEQVAELGQQPAWVAALQAAGDRARQQGGKRGRARKGNKATGQATRPAGAPSAIN
jgi:hypothetical protein